MHRYIWEPCQRAAEEFLLGIERSQHSGDTVEERKVSTAQGATRHFGKEDMCGS